jgi:sugar phosphate isomerase/epimerase
MAIRHDAEGQWLSSAVPASDTTSAQVDLFRSGSGCLAPRIRPQGNNMDNLGIEYLSVFGLPPVQFVHLAADLGCRFISTGLTPMPFNPYGYPDWSLLAGQALRREMVAAMRERGVSISLGEGFIVRPGVEMRDRIPDLEAMKELGVTRVNIASIEPDSSRSLDQYGAFVDMARALELDTTIEFAPLFATPNIAAAIEVVRQIDRPNFRLLVDTLHLARSGATAAEVAALDPELIGYVQLCDAPLAATQAEYMHQARYERMSPGDGELPLLAVLQALPHDRVIGLEIPLRSQAEAGVGPHELVGRCVKAARSLLAQRR